MGLWPTSGSLPEGLKDFLSKFCGFIVWFIPSFRSAMVKGAPKIFDDKCMTESSSVLLKRP